MPWHSAYLLGPPPSPSPVVQVLPAHVWCSPSMSERLTQLYCSSTFGDPLLGCLIATALLPSCSGAVTLEVLNALIDVSAKGERAGEGKGTGGVGE